MNQTIEEPQPNPNGTTTRQIAGKRSREKNENNALKNVAGNRPANRGATSRAGTIRHTKTTNLKTVAHTNHTAELV
ncbi:MAG TPA: hypothetical protein GX000_01875 [Actinomyces sp.]|jgi:hypothetical protein|nr:hypothetical protein [Actinomyces sp.]